MKHIPIYTSTRYYGSLPQEGSAMKGIIVAFLIEAAIGLIALSVWGC
jgi:hypothetical protein